MSEKKELEQIPFKLITTSQYWSSEDIPSFVAISYCWKSSDWHIPERFYNGKKNWTFPITPASLNAVFTRYLVDRRITAGFAIWIDQICIDQDNPDQKLHAIANMDTIYRNASEVCILLEDVDLSYYDELALSNSKSHEQVSLGSCADQVQFESSNYLEITEATLVEADKSCTEDNFRDGFLKAFLGGTTRLFDSRWFERAWCRQEFLLSSQSVFVVIGREFDFVGFEPLSFRHIPGLWKKHSISRNELFSNPYYKDFWLGISRRRNKQHEVKYGTSCLFELFVRLANLGCTFRRDIVSVALNASGIRLSFHGNALRQRELRFVLIMIALAAGDASALAFKGFPLEVKAVPGHQSIIRWPELNFQVWIAMWKSGPPCLGLDPQIWQTSPIALTLAIFQLPSRWQASSTMDRGDPDESQNLQPAKCPESAMLEDFRSLAASVGFVSKPGWLEWVISSCERFPSRDQFYSYQFDDGDIWRFPWELLSRAYQIGEKFVHARVSTPQGYSAIRLMGLLHETSCAADDMSDMIADLNTSGTEQAILFIPSNLTDGVRRGLFSLAVPVALNNMSSVTIPRLWILEPSRTDQSALSLVGCGYYIAPTDIDRERHDRIRYVHHATILGEWQEKPFPRDACPDWFLDESEA